MSIVVADMTRSQDVVVWCGQGHRPSSGQGGGQVQLGRKQRKLGRSSENQKTFTRVYNGVRVGLHGCLDSPFSLACQSGEKKSLCVQTEVVLYISSENMPV